MQLAGESQEVWNTGVCSGFGFELLNKWLPRVLFSIRKFLKQLSPRQYPSKLDLQVKNLWWTATSFSLFFCACTEESTWGRLHSACLFLFPFHGYGQENFYRENSAMWRVNWPLLEIQSMKASKRNISLPASCLLHLWALPCFRRMQWS